MKILEQLEALERALVTAGFPAMSEWWRQTLARFYESGRRQLVLRVGRRGGKSSSLCRVAVLEALCGEHKVSAGDVGTVAILSVRRDEAADRLRTLAAILDALKVAYVKRDDTIELADRPIRFKVYTASLSGVVGGTIICAICDEVCRWADLDSGANPAKEVLASLRPALATMPNAKLFLSSSPWSTLDAHFEAIERGDDGFQCVALAPTWVANPTITEEETHAIEPDARLWSRGFAAIPTDALGAAFDSDGIDAAMRPPPPIEYAGRPILAIDASGGSSDAFAWCVAGYMLPLPPPEFLMASAIGPTGEVIARDAIVVRDDEGNMVRDPEFVKARRPLLVISEVRGIANAREKMTTSDLIKQLAKQARSLGITRAFGDQYASWYLASEFAKQGLLFTGFNWTQTTKGLAVARLRQLLAERSIILPDDEKLRAELVRYAERYRKSGIVSYEAKTGHDDLVATILTTLLAETEGGLEMSPAGGDRRRFEW